MSEELRGTFKADLKIGVCVSLFNREVTEKLEKAALAELVRMGLRPEQCELVHVPGAFEIPLTCQWLLQSGCSGVLALGAVIRGDTPHFDYVCRAVERGCLQVALDSNKPVVFGVLTTDNESQAFERAGGEHGNKGRDGAEALVSMLKLKDRLLK